MSNTKRVLFFQHAGVLGGSVKNLRMLVQSLSGMGYEPRVCLLRPNRETVEYYQDYGVPVFVTWDVLPLFHCQGSWANFADPFASATWMRGLLHWRRSVVETTRIVRKNPCDIVHVNSSILAPSALALRRMGQCFVWHVREAPQPRYLGVRLRRYRRWLRDWPTERVFLSATDRLGWMGDESCGEVIPHGVADELFELPAECPEARRELGIPTGDYCILYLGGFSRIKGIFVLLDALEMLIREGTRFTCLMPGTVRTRSQSLRSRAGRLALRVVRGGTDEMQALGMLKARGLKDVVRLFPFQEDVRRFFQAADVLVFPSTVPHFALPVIEAAAAGKPVVASGFAGMKELVEDQKAGLLVEPGDAPALAEALRALLHSRTRREELGARARQQARAYYTQRIEAARFVTVYDRIVQVGQPRG